MNEEKLHSTLQTISSIADLNLKKVDKVDVIITFSHLKFCVTVSLFVCTSVRSSTFLSTKIQSNPCTDFWLDRLSPFTKKDDWKIAPLFFVLINY